MAEGPPPRAGLIGWSRAWIAAGKHRAGAGLADVGRRPHHLLVAGLAGGLAVAPAPTWVGATATVIATALAAGAARSSHARELPMVGLAVGAIVAGAALGGIRLSAIDSAARRGGPD